MHTKSLKNSKQTIRHVLAKIENCPQKVQLLKGKNKHLTKPYIKFILKLKMADLLLIRSNRSEGEELELEDLENEIRNNKN